jgi:predicted RNA binding protein YcfA (HicA-like mRNA interferase family)
MSPKLKPLRLPPSHPTDVSLVARRLPELGWMRVRFPGSAVRFVLNAEHRF